MVYKSLIIFLLLFNNIWSIAYKATSMPVGGKHHQQWVNCFIVTIKGDTILGQVKNKKDFSAEGSLLPGDEILIRLLDGTEEKLGIHVLQELFIPDNPAENRKYLSLNTNPSYSGKFIFYRVIVDGLCKLLYSEIPGNPGKMVATTTGGGQLYNTPMNGIIPEYDIYYKNKLSKVQLDDDFNLSPISKKDCLEIFKDCPDLVQKIIKSHSQPSKLTDMIKIFNECKK